MSLKRHPEALGCMKRCRKERKRKSRSEARRHGSWVVKCLEGKGERVLRERKILKTVYKCLLSVMEGS